MKGRIDECLASLATLVITFNNNSFATTTNRLRGGSGRCYQSETPSQLRRKLVSPNVCQRNKVHLPRDYEEFFREVSTRPQDIGNLQSGQRMQTRSGDVPHRTGTGQGQRLCGNRATNVPPSRHIGHIQENQMENVIGNSFEEDFAAGIGQICEIPSPFADFFSRLPDMIRCAYKNYFREQRTSRPIEKEVAREEVARCKQVCDPQTQQLRQQVGAAASGFRGVQNPQMRRQMGAVMGGFEGGTANFLKRKAGKIPITNPDICNYNKTYKGETAPWGMDWSDVDDHPDYAEFKEAQQRHLGRQGDRCQPYSGKTVPWGMDWSDVDDHPDYEEFRTAQQHHLKRANARKCPQKSPPKGARRQPYSGKTVPWGMDWSDVDDHPEYKAFRQVQQRHLGQQGAQQCNRFCS